MGLDMYCLKTKDEITSDVDFKVENSEQVSYWRKHSDLHGWMQRLYYQKGGQDESFNCVNVKLDLQDLNSLEEDILGNNLPNTSGFFFGNSYLDDDEKQQDMQEIVKLKLAILKEYTVYYTSWW